MVPAFVHERSPLAVTTKRLWLAQPGLIVHVRKLAGARLAETKG
jgi:hypothetical protein